MRLPNIRVIALLGGLAIAGCGTSDIKHGSGGNGGTGGGGNGGSGGGGSGGSGGGGSGGSGGGGGPNCGVQNFTLNKGGTPDLLIVQDRSGSMSMDANGGSTTPSKWTSITTAINQVVGQINTVDWGLLFFSPVMPNFLNPCAVPSTPDVACGPNTASQISSAIAGTKPMSGTPTPEALNAAVQYFQGNNDGNAHYILLATDGLPQCDTMDDSAAAISAVMSAVTAGIKVVVVGIGNDPMGDMTLTSMANAGGMPDTSGSTPYYQVNTTTDLVTALDKIAGQIVSCSYPLQMAPANPDYVEIDDNNGMKIPHDTTHMNGWDYGPGNLSIIFYGMACDNLQKGVTTSIQAVFGCPPVG